MSDVPFRVIPPPSAEASVGEAVEPSSMFLSSTLTVVLLIVVVVPSTTRLPETVRSLLTVASPVTARVPELNVRFPLSSSSPSVPASTTLPDVKSETFAVEATKDESVPTAVMLGCDAVLTVPVKLPVTLPVTSPVRSPVTSPVTSPVKSPVTPTGALRAVSYTI